MFLLGVFAADVVGTSTVFVLLFGHVGSGNCGAHSGSDLPIHITESQSNANWIPARTAQ